LEEKKDIPYAIIEALPSKEIKERKILTHIHTNFLRKKFPLPKFNEL
jgi:hypothetical protein